MLNVVLRLKFPTMHSAMELKDPPDQATVQTEVTTLSNLLRTYHLEKTFRETYGKPLTDSGSKNKIKYGETRSK